MTAVIAVASGVIFWGVGLISEPLSALFQFVPGMSALTWGLFYFAGPLAAVIVRKPGAALFAELIAGIVEAFLGSHWGGLGTILPGLIQGLAPNSSSWPSPTRRGIWR
ncbi:ECF transporter S component [Bifidobacterium mongoliense]|uniref:ECF transporter S component n=1 Tax=Bifidobacterium mongoliense TaxID=518643 RepID=UPI000A886641|nr:ECF transporter S component [Bifidobacterium mongoliense]